MSDPLCPRCHEPMREKNLAGLRFSQCQVCDGVWISQSTLLQLRGLDLEKHPLFFQEDPPSTEQYRHFPCPRCGHEMHAFNYRESSTVVDQCPLCNFFFFDVGELGEALEDWKLRPNAPEHDLLVPAPNNQTPPTDSIGLLFGLLGGMLLSVSWLPIWPPVQLAMLTVGGLLLTLAIGRFVLVHRKKRDHDIKKLDAPAQLIVRDAAPDYRSPAPAKKTINDTSLQKSTSA